MRTGSRPRVRLVLALLVGTGTIMGGNAAAQDLEHHQAGGTELGSVSFATSCSGAVSEKFEEAVAMLHSFWFPQAMQAFGAVAEGDPGCAMAHWGMAMTTMGNPMARVVPAAEALGRGRAAAERARELAATQSHREQMYAASVVAYYEGDGRDYTSRMTAHEKVLGELRAAHPDDMEGTIFHARAMVANAPPTDLTFSRQVAGADMLLPLFETNPDHPGLAHYIIHAYDAPALAARGSKAAFAYAGIAPAAPHALHMPSHIFTRLGYWKESIDTNRRSAEAEPDPNAAVHPMDYMVYASLQLGMDRAAREVIDRATANGDRLAGGSAGYNYVAMPARYALERSDWRGASELRIPVGALPHVEAILHFARAIGTVRVDGSGNPTESIAALARLESALLAQNDAYWTTIVRAQRFAAESWALHGRGEATAALAMAEYAADLEETVEKHPVTPGPIIPARELFGDLLLLHGRPADALLAYEKVLEREPNRARALFGAARAADLSQRGDRARSHYTALQELMAEADPDRPERQAARNFLN